MNAGSEAVKGQQLPKTGKAEAKLQLLSRAEIKN